MTQLWAWEYEGKMEFGCEISRGFEGTRRFMRVDCLARDERFITDLRKVKVVDEDAVQERTSADGLWVHDGKEWRTRYAMWRGKPLKTKEDWDNYYLAINPPVTKTYLTTDQFIKVYKSLNDEKSRELSAARDAAWYAARDATRDEARYAAWYAAWDEARYAAWYAAWDEDLAVLAKDKITTEQFEILTSPWTSCGLSLYAEDWDEVLSPKVTEPTGFAAVVKASNPRSGGEFLWVRIRDYRLEQEDNFVWESENGYREPWGNLFNPIIISEGIEG